MTKVKYAHFCNWAPPPNGTIGWEHYWINPLMRTPMIESPLQGTLNPVKLN